MCHLDGTMPILTAGKTAVLVKVVGDGTYKVMVLDLPHVLATYGYDCKLYNLAVCPVAAVSDAIARTTIFQLVLVAFVAALRADGLT